MKKRMLLCIFIGLWTVVTSCSEKATRVEETTTKEIKIMEWKAPEKSNVDVSKKYTATIKTDRGDIVCELFAKDAPLSVTNFKYLADNDFYKGLTFHRVVPDFVVQGGDPTGTGSGGPGYTIPAEIGKSHIEGALAWARTGDEVNPERRSSGSQFYITLKPTPFLDGAYSVFGKTLSGQDVVQKIQSGDKIIDVIVEEKG
jgi:cyclophilin family peptidyl-prolyl cis-trans isomerase